MFTSSSPRPILVLFAIILSVTACNSKKEQNISKVETSAMACTENGYVFCYTDIENFRKTFAVMQQGGDTIAAFEDYFAKASPGMKGWISRYNWTPKKLAERVAKQPKYYESLQNIDTELRKFEKDISRHYDSMKKLYPFEFVTIPPTYYFIMWGGGGSIELTGNMISMDYFGYKEGLDQTEFEEYGGLFPEGRFPIVSATDVPQVAVHEVSHLFQTYLQGEIDYVSMYIEESKTTMLAYAVREGTADFIAYLASGLTDTKRHVYGDANEKELWELFKPHLSEHPDNHKGWFSGKSETHSDWPWQVGYYVGFKMIQNYYDLAEDKELVIVDILSAKDETTYRQMAALYDKKFHDK